MLINLDVKAIQFSLFPGQCGREVPPMKQGQIVSRHLVGSSSPVLKICAPIFLLQAKLQLRARS